MTNKNNPQELTDGYHQPEDDFHRLAQDEALSFSQLLEMFILRDSPDLIELIETFHIPKQKNGDATHALNQKFKDLLEERMLGGLTDIQVPEAFYMQSGSADYEMQDAFKDCAESLAAHKFLVGAAKGKKGTLNHNYELHDFDSKNREALATRFLMVALVHRARFQALMEFSTFWGKLANSERAITTSNREKRGNTEMKKDRVLDLLKYYVQQNKRLADEGKKIVRYKSLEVLSEALSEDFLNKAKKNDWDAAAIVELQKHLRLQDVNTENLSEEERNGFKPRTLDGLLSRHKKEFAEHLALLLIPKKSQAKSTE